MIWLTALREATLQERSAMLQIHWTEAMPYTRGLLELCLRVATARIFEH